MQILTGPEICNGCDKKSPLVAEYTLETFNDPELFRICATCLQAALDTMRTYEHVLEGVEQAARGELVSLGSFAQYADEADEQEIEDYANIVRRDAEIEMEAEQCQPK